MIRYAKHHNKDYIVVDSSIELNGVSVPMQVQINITEVKSNERPKLFRIASIAFNRNLNFDKPKPEPVKKAWYKFW